MFDKLLVEFYNTYITEDNNMHTSSQEQEKAAEFDPLLLSIIAVSKKKKEEMIQHGGGSTLGKRSQRIYNGNVMRTLGSDPEDLYQSPTGSDLLSQFWDQGHLGDTDNRRNFNTDTGYHMSTLCQGTLCSDKKSNYDNMTPMMGTTQPIVSSS